MYPLRSIVALLGLLFASTVKAHPGHLSLSMEHVHRAYEFDPLFSLLLIAALAVVIALSRMARRERR